MSELVYARVVERLLKLRLVHVSVRLDSLLSEAARHEPTWLDFIDQLLDEEVQSKQKKRVQMGIQIAHFPTVKTVDDVFKFQPGVDARLVKELATGRFVENAENVLLFGPPGVGKTHVAIALGRAVVEAGHSVLLTSTVSLIAVQTGAGAAAKGGVKCPTRAQWPFWCSRWPIWVFTMAGIRTRRPLPPRDLVAPRERARDPSRVMATDSLMAPRTMLVGVPGGPPRGSEQRWSAVQGGTHRES